MSLFPSRPAVPIVALILLIAGSTMVHAESIPLAKNSSSRYTIAVAADASAPEKHAAEELATYLRQITGARFPVRAPENVGRRPMIAVGPGAARYVAPKLSLARADLGDDGIVMKTLAPNLILTGAEGSRRGTLYAVYSFLEDVLGVRWWTETASYVPHRPSLTVEPLDVRYVPVLPYREALYNTLRGRGLENGAGRTKFVVRQKYNGHFNAIPAEWGGSYYLIGWCHTFDLFLPPSKYFKDHPEWYALVNGERKGEHSQLCCTNDEMIAELSKQVLAFIAQRPDAGIISVAQNDWGNNCRCDKCRALDEAEGSPSGSLLYCVNKVAEAVEKEYPDFLVETLAYQYTRRPPKNLRPRDNVIVRLAVIERSGHHPIDSEMNRSLMADLRAWKAAAPNLFIWDYTANMTGAFTPHPNLPVFAPDIRTYVDSNARGIFFEGNHYAGEARGDFDELKTYLMAQLLWDPSRDEKRIVREFLNGYYGAAGPILSRYLDLQVNAARDVRLPSWSAGPDAGWLDLAAMNRATKLFDEAEQAVADDAERLDRVRRARIQLDHQWLRGYLNYRLQAEDGGREFLGPQDIAAATEEFISRVRRYESENIRVDGTQSLEQLAAALRLRAESMTNPPELPAMLRDVPAARIVDAQECDFRLASGAAIAPDAPASNGFAAKMDPAVLSWSVQYHGIGPQIPPGRWHVYASVRCEKVKDSGVAFTAGVYDAGAAKNLLGLSVNLEDQGQAQDVDPNVATQTTVTPPEGAGDEQYHLYDLGAHDLNGQTYVWFGTTGGVSPDNVKAIYVDRVILVRE